MKERPSVWLETGVVLCGAAAAAPSCLYPCRCRWPAVPLWVPPRAADGPGGDRGAAGRGDVERGATGGQETPAFFALRRRGGRGPAGRGWRGAALGSQTGRAPLYLGGRGGGRAELRPSGGRRPRPGQRGRCSRLGLALAARASPARQGRMREWQN